MNLPIVVGTVPYRRVPFLLTPTTRHMPAGCHGMQYLPVVVPPPYRENPTPPPPVDGLFSPVFCCSDLLFDKTTMTYGITITDVSVMTLN